MIIQLISDKLADEQGIARLVKGKALPALYEAYIEPKMDIWRGWGYITSIKAPGVKWLQECIDGMKNGTIGFKYQGLNLMINE